MIKLAKTSEGKIVLQIAKSDWEKIGVEQGWLGAEAAKKTKGPKKAYPICMKSIQDKHGPKSTWSDATTEKFDSCVKDVKAKSAASPSITVEAEKDGDWPKSEDLDKGSFTTYCKEQGFEGPCIECAKKAMQSDSAKIRGKASFYMNTVKPSGKTTSDL